jgi:hypothetical protein
MGRVSGNGSWPAFRELGESEPLILARILHKQADDVMRDAGKMRRFAAELIDHLSELEDTHRGDTSDGRNGKRGSPVG